MFRVRWGLLPAVITGLVLVALGGGVDVAPSNASAPERGSLLLLLDSSGSMKEPAEGGQTKIEAAKQALGSVVDGLPDDARVGLRVYGATVHSKRDPGACRDSQLVVPVGPVAKPALQKAIQRYRPYGETPIAYSLKRAAADLGDSGKRTILLVSDGEETCDPDPCGVARELARKGIDLRIDVVGFRVSGAARDQLRCIAENGRGDYYDASSADDLLAELDKLSTRAYRPFQVLGKPVEGASTPGAAPEIGAGRYTTTVPVGGSEPTYYAVPKTPGSTLWVSVTARPPYSSASGQRKLAVGAVDPVSRCTVEGGEFTGNRASTHNVLVANVLVDARAADGAECAGAGRVLIAVKGADLSGTAGSGWKAEIDVVEEPPVTSTSGLPPRASTSESSGSSWQGGSGATEIVGATTLAEATALRPGEYRDTIVPGERLVYRVRAEFGQRVRADVFLPRATPALARALPVTRGRQVFPVYGRMYGPNGVDMTVGHAVPHGLLSGLAPASFGMSSPEIRYLNRTSSDNRLRGSAVAGDYYIEVNVPRHGDETYAIPFQLRVAVAGSPAGRPSYGALRPSPSPAPSGAASSAPSSSSAPDSTSSGPASSWTPGTVLTAGVALVALLAVVAVVILVIALRRRTTR